MMAYALVLMTYRSASSTTKVPRTVCSSVSTIRSRYGWECVVVPPEPPLLRRCW
jgi:hypothetical protein